MNVDLQGPPIDRGPQVTSRAFRVNWIRRCTGRDARGSHRNQGFEPSCLRMVNNALMMLADAGHDSMLNYRFMMVNKGCRMD